MPKFQTNINLETATDIQFKNTSGTNTGKIEADGNNLVISNAVGDVLLGDGSSDIFIGDGTNSVDILFEVSGSIKAEDGSSGVTLTVGSADTTLALIPDTMIPSAVNAKDIGSNDYPFRDIYAAHHVGGSSINYATSRGWVEDPVPLSETQVGFFGGNFVKNGDVDENAVVRGQDCFNNKALLWKAIAHDTDNDADGGWVKNITIPANNDIGYLSYVYFMADFTADSSTENGTPPRDGTVYLGCGTTAGQTLNISDDSNNTNPYFVAQSLFTINNGSPAVANRWYLMIGVLQPYNDETTGTDTISGVYDVETGEKVLNGAEFKMGNNTTTQMHRTYLYYDQSGDPGENVYFWNPGFHAIDGSEPKLQDLLKRQTIANTVKVGRDADNLIDFTADNRITFRVQANNELGLEANALYPLTSDGLALGYANYQWADLFLASGSVINFNNGDVTLTHSGNNLAIAGGNFEFTGYGFVMDGNTITGVDDSGEFTNDDAHIMTSAAVEDKILGYSYTANALPLSGGTMTGNITVDQADDVLITNATNDKYEMASTTSLLNAMPFPSDFHDVLSFGRNYTITQEISTDGTNFSSMTLESGVFDLRLDSATTVIDGSLSTEEQATRYIITNVAYVSAQFLKICFTHQSNIPSVTVTVETCSDGTFGVGTTTQRHQSTITSATQKTAYFYLNGHSADTHMRITLDKGNNTDNKSVTVSSIQLLTRRNGDQGQGPEYNLPIDWDYDRNVTVPGKLTVTGADAITIPDYILHTGDTNSKFGFPSNDNFKIRLNGSDVFTMSETVMSFTGEVEGTVLDINGDADISGALVMGGAITIPEYINHASDGDTAFGFATDDTFRVITGSTTRLNIATGIELTGNTTLTGTLTVGVDDTGYDVKFFGATSGRFLQWDESEDYLLFRDNVKGVFGNGADLKLYHDSNNSYIENGTGGLYIMQRTDGADMSFQCDAGDGTDAEYFRLDGGDVKTIFSKPIQVGVDDTGHDVKFFGATSGKYMLWDESADKLIINGVLDLNGTAVTSTAAELNLLDTAEAGTIVNSKAVIYDGNGKINASGFAISGSAITSTAAELNVLDGYTGSVTELNYLDTLHATGVTNTEFDYLDGVTSNIQTQLNAKQATLTFGKSSGNALKSEEALTTNDVLLMGSSNVKGRTYAEFKSDLQIQESFIIACSDESSNLTTGTAKVTFQMPYAFTLTSVKASVNTAPVGSAITVDINEGGSTILSTKLTIDATEKTSTSAATPAVISDTGLANNAEITIDIDGIGSGNAGKGLKVTLIGYQ